MSELTPQSGTIVSELANDPDLAELVEMFVEELPDRISAIEKTISEQDYDGLKRLAHQLKGAAGGYGFPIITDAARSLEEKARTEQDLDAINTELRQLADLCHRASARPDNGD